MPLAMVSGASTQQYSEWDTLSVHLVLARQLEAGLTYCIFLVFEWISSFDGNSIR